MAFRPAVAHKKCNGGAPDQQSGRSIRLRWKAIETALEEFAADWESALLLLS